VKKDVLLTEQDGILYITSITNANVVHESQVGEVL